jgi:hypothetical protein
MKAFTTALFAIVVTTASAVAQIDKERISAETATAIEHPLDHRKSVKMDLRGKVISRLFECALLYRGLSDASHEPRFKEAAQILLDTSVLLSKQISPADLETLLEAGKQEAFKLRERNDKKEGFYVLRNCQTFTDLRNIDAAVSELTY